VNLGDYNLDLRVNIMNKSWAGERVS